MTWFTKVLLDVGVIRDELEEFRTRAANINRIEAIPETERTEDDESELWWERHRLNNGLINQRLLMRYWRFNWTRLDGEAQRMLNEYDCNYFQPTA